MYVFGCCVMTYITEACVYLVCLWMVCRQYLSSWVCLVTIKITWHVAIDTSDRSDVCRKTANSILLYDNYHIISIITLQRILLPKNADFVKIQNFVIFAVYSMSIFIAVFSRDFHAI